MNVAIFGATSAIAEASARLWAAEGAKLFLAGRRVDTLQEVSSDLEVRGAPVVAIWSGDLADPATHAVALDVMEQEIGAPDVTLIAWGTLTDQERAERDAAYAARELSGNFTAPASLILALVPRLAEGGLIACITSVAGDRGRGSNHVYGAAKGGLQRFLEGLRHRLASRGIAVLDVRPGFVATPMTAHIAQDGPLWAQPEDIARDIVRAVARRRAAVLYTPWFWRWIMLVVRSLPRAILHRTKL